MAMPVLIQAIGAVAQLNTAWNTANSSTASNKGPATGFITTASRRVSARAPRLALRRLDLRRGLRRHHHRRVEHSRQPQLHRSGQVFVELTLLHRALGIY
jgi:hypothetical protein